MSDRHTNGCEVLAVFAHPDDESLLAGGTLAACSAAGLEVGIVSLTRGELGPSGDRASDRERLARLREEELARAAQALGASWARCLSLPDGELSFTDRAAAVRQLGELLVKVSPHLVLTFSSDGLYWHPDHLAAREIVHAATTTAVCEFTWPQGLLADTVRQLQRRGLPCDMWGLDPDAFGAEADTALHELDVSAFLADKLGALRCHESQLGAEHALSRLPADLARGLLGREWLLAGEHAQWLCGIVAQGVERRVSG